MDPKQIKAIRREAGLTQGGLGVLLRILDKRTIRRWEKGEVEVSGPVSLLLELLASNELPARLVEEAKREG